MNKSKDYKKKLVRILKRHLTTETTKPIYIAAIIAMAVKEGKLPLGTKIHSRIELAPLLNVTVKTMENTWKILRSQYELIITDRSQGTRIVLKLTESMSMRIPLSLKELNNDVYESLFNNETMSGFLSGKRGFHTAWRLASSQYTNRDSAGFDQVVIPGMITQLLILAAEKLNYQPCIEEIYFSDDYRLLLIHICDVLLSARKRVVVMQPTSALLESSLKIAKLKIQYMGLGTMDERLDMLEDFIIHGQVGMVYISYSAPYTNCDELTDAQWIRLKGFQANSNFMIFIDDRFGSLKISPVVFEDISARENTSIIYLGPVPPLNDDMAAVNLVVAPRKIINKIIKKFEMKSMQVSRSTGNAFLKMAVNGDIKKYAKAANKAMQIRVAMVKTELRASNLFVDYYLDNQQLWFFYLQLADGNSFIKGVEQKLASLNMVVMKNAAFRCRPYYEEGIFISVSSFENDTLCKRDLIKLIDNLRKMINTD